MANNRNKYPRVRANITFRIKEEGGRKTPIKDNYHYCPHIVIGDPGQKKAIIESGNKLSENYLGIQKNIKEEEKDYKRKNKPFKNRKGKIEKELVKMKNKLAELKNREKDLKNKENKFKSKFKNNKILLENTANSAGERVEVTIIYE